MVLKTVILPSGSYTVMTDIQVIFYPGRLIPSSFLEQPSTHYCAQICFD